jgi:hypothetical protein
MVKRLIGNAKNKLIHYVYDCANTLWVWAGYFSRHKTLCILSVGSIALSGCILVGVIKGIPAPACHDEFSYLLAADTFTKGRLSNPLHPMGIHFESFHIIQRPTYMSKMPPAQGLILAAGKILFGEPIFGVWLSMALMCGAICWMLQGWLPSRWGLVGGLFVILHPTIGITSYWAQSYWGGAVGALGGALVFGALPRIIRKPSVNSALMMGLGFIVLANSRPFEGFFTILPVLIFFSFWVILKILKGCFGFIFSKVLFPMIIIGACAFVFMGYYNKCITQDALVMPYQVYESEYSSSPLFIFQNLRQQPIFRNKEMSSFDKDFMAQQYNDYRSFYKKSHLRYIKWKLKFFYDKFVPNITYAIPMFFSIYPLIFGTFGWGLVFSYIVILSFLLPSIFCVWNYTHYASPIISVYLIISMQGLMMLSLLKKSSKEYIGRFLVILIIFIWCFSLVLSILSNFFTAPVYSKRSLVGLLKPRSSPSYFWAQEREKINDALSKSGRKNIIIVRYYEPHNLHCEWVYNEANIDNSKVIWARDLGVNSNKALLSYFKDRKAWLLEVKNDEEKPALIDYVES